MRLRSRWFCARKPTSHMSFGLNSVCHSASALKARPPGSTVPSISACKRANSGSIATRSVQGESTSAFTVFPPVPFRRFNVGPLGRDREMKRPLSPKAARLLPRVVTNRFKTEEIQNLILGQWLSPQSLQPLQAVSKQTCNDASAEILVFDRVVSLQKFL